MILRISGLLFAAAYCLCAQQTPKLPDDYIARAPITATGLAPGMKVQPLGTTARTFKVTFTKGDEVMSGLTEFAEKNHLKTSYITGVGAFSSALFGWTDPAKRAMKKIPIDQEAEVVSFIGNISVRNGKPNVHVHGAVAYPDGSIHGGHLIEGHVGLIMEVFVTELADNAKTEP